MVNFVDPTINESEKINNYFNLARELRTLWNMSVTIIPMIPF